MLILIISFCEIGHYSMMILQDHHEITDMNAEETNEKDAKEKKIEDPQNKVELLSQIALISQEEYRGIYKFRSPLKGLCQFEQSIPLPPPELS